MLFGLMAWLQPASAATTALEPLAPGQAEATFAGGCFWCMEPPFEALPGVISVVSGYTGGRTKNPSYEDVSSGVTGHAEAVRIVYEPSKVSFEQLLEVFWHNIDPLTPDQQFCDKGTQYRSAIFYHDEAQRAAAEASKDALAASGRFKTSVVTSIVPARAFFPAEEYHQDYYRHNPLRYKYYRHGCGRDERLQELWGMPSTK
ncbi:MAG: peptide-methionine (S)-S-oxide reductase [Betaproteobacteria bacterium]|nr:peptide-methionine (S)-S-oxide reductase [Betaproteobacteria bacterium]